VIEDGNVVHEVRYPHPVPAVWDALTDPSALAAWLMPNDFALTVGHRFRLDARPRYGMIDGEVLDVDPPRLLRCRWTIEGVPTTVTVRLHADGDGTVLHLEHVRLTPEMRPDFDGGWGQKLGTDIDLVLAGDRDPERSYVDDGLRRHSDLEAPG